MKDFKEILSLLVDDFEFEESWNFNQYSAPLMIENHRLNRKSYDLFNFPKERVWSKMDLVNFDNNFIIELVSILRKALKSNYSTFVISTLPHEDEIARVIEDVNAKIKYLDSLSGYAKIMNGGFKSLFLSTFILPFLYFMIGEWDNSTIALEQFKKRYIILPERFNKVIREINFYTNSLKKLLKEENTELKDEKHNVYIFLSKSSKTSSDANHYQLEQIKTLEKMQFNEDFNVKVRFTLSFDTIDEIAKLVRIDNSQHKVSLFFVGHGDNNDRTFNLYFSQKSEVSLDSAKIFKYFFNSKFKYDVISFLSCADGAFNDLKKISDHIISPNYSNFVNSEIFLKQFLRQYSKSENVKTAFQAGMLALQITVGGKDTLELDGKKLRESN